jgi:manganese-dependent inorganic pyrophosphatase
METAILRVRPDTLLTEVAEDLFASPLREAVVEDERGKLIGLITRTSIATARPRRVILVDHNEIAQSAPGIETASVVEIVDHHRIGDIQTPGPVTFLNLPFGSTATIVAERYREADIEPGAAIAGVLLSAVLSDTLLLKSPTTTETDREVAESLSEVAGVDLEAFGMELFKARSGGRGFSVERAVTGDLKEYVFGDARIAVGQVETVDAGEYLARKADLLEFMDSYREARGYDLVALMVTDVLEEGTELLVSGRSRLAERAFDTSFEDGSAWLPSVLSRKKQVAARLAESLGS